MGGGASKRTHILEVSERFNSYPTCLFDHERLVGSQWEKRYIEISTGILALFNEDHEFLKEIKLDRTAKISSETPKEIVIRQNDLTLSVQFQRPNEAASWKQVIREDILVHEARMMEGNHRGLDIILETLDQCSDSDEEIEVESGSFRTSIKAFQGTRLKQTHSEMVDTLAPPRMRIVILVVGTRGDVQPFVHLGLELQRQGHTVRIGTHAEYRDFVTSHGLKFYPLAGDPRKLSEYMVKTAGRLIPDLLSGEERGVLPEKMQMLRDICFSTWPACTEADPEDEKKEPFLAEAMISNPVSYGHIHCCEALAIPLHIMFPQPWYPTKAFPHPLSNLGFKSAWSLKNRYSYRLVDEVMWVGLGSIINDFRKKILLLPPIRTGEGGDSLLVDRKVPISHMWSPSFVPRCLDWPAHVNVVGDFVAKPRNVSAVEDSKQQPYTPDPLLVDFLSSLGHEKPVFIGFGSMVIAEPEKLVDIVKNASEETDVAIILQSGWTKYAEDYSMISKKVIVVGAMPHDWLFKNVSATIHHGGAGTTSAALRAGNPTFICPFFGDQHFWAEMVFRAGVGPRGCPIRQLTTQKLVDALQLMKSEAVQLRVQELSASMIEEDGVASGVESFLQHLPLEDMLCEVSLFSKENRIARVYCQHCGLKMSVEVDCVAHRYGGGRSNHIRVPYRCVNWGLAPPSSLLEGLEQGVAIAAYEFAGGFYDLVAKPIQGAREKGAVGAAVGMAKGVAGLIARPIKGGGILIDKVTKGMKTDSSLRRNRSVPVNAAVDPHQRATISFVNHLSTKVEGETEEEEAEEGELESLNPEARELEEDLQRALRFREFWMKLDTSGDRFVCLEELENFMPRAEAEALLKTADSNHDGELTFAELAFNIMRHTKVPSV